MIVDAHQHFWRRSRGDYDWPTPDLTAIYRDFEPEELAAKLAALGIDRTIAVQATPTVEESLFLLELAESHAFIAGVVGWVDMEDAEAPQTIERLARNPKFKGIRPMIQGIADDAWMLQPRLAPAFEAIVANGLRFDALVLPRHLPNLLTLLGRYPDLQAIVDHGAKPPIASGGLDRWATDIARIAGHTSAYCKLSGLVTEAGDDPSITRIKPVFAHLLQTFGPARLVWGSDWPVVNLADSYEGWWGMAQQLCAPLQDSERQAIFGGNACRFYGLGPGSGEQ